MTPWEATRAMWALLDELRKKYVPDEGNKAQGIGQLGFDYGYQQALVEVRAGLYRAFPEGETPPTK